MVTASPPVSPSVVARILTIQNTNVTWGTFATSSDIFLSILSSQNHRSLLARQRITASFTESSGGDFDQPKCKSDLRYLVVHASARLRKLKRFIRIAARPANRRRSVRDQAHAVSVTARGKDRARRNS